MDGQENEDSRKMFFLVKHLVLKPNHSASMNKIAFALFSGYQLGEILSTRNTVGYGWF